MSFCETVLDHEVKCPRATQGVGHCLRQGGGVESCRGCPFSILSQGLQVFPIPHPFSTVGFRLNSSLCWMRGPHAKTFHKPQCHGVALAFLSNQSWERGLDGPSHIWVGGTWLGGAEQGPSATSPEPPQELPPAGGISI